MKSKQKDPLKSSFLRGLKRNFPQQWPFLQAGNFQKKILVARTIFPRSKSEQFSEQNTSVHNL